MGHEFETGLTVGEQSWHKLERNVKTPVATIKEALALAGMDWLVDLKPIYRQLDDGSLQQVEGNAVVRLSDNSTLSVVGPGYRPVQNAEAFEPLQPLVDAKYMSIDSAGSLRRGARVYMSCKLTAEASEVVPGDTVEGYFLAYQGFDGKTRLCYKHTPVRVVCMNTLGMATVGDEKRAEGYSTEGVSFSHNGDISGRVAKFAEQINYMAKDFSSTIEVYRDLARKQMHPKAFFETLLKLEERRLAAEAAGKTDSQPGQRQLDALLESYETQPGKQYGQGTAWQAYNAVTYWVDHTRGREENRKDNSLFGYGASLKREALKLAVAA